MYIHMIWVWIRVLNVPKCRTHGNRKAKSEKIVTRRGRKIHLFIAVFDTKYPCIKANTTTEILIYLNFIVSFAWLYDDCTIFILQIARVVIFHQCTIHSISFLVLAGWCWCQKTNASLHTKHRAKGEEKNNFRLMFCYDGFKYIIF